MSAFSYQIIFLGWVEEYLLLDNYMQKCYIYVVYLSQCTRTHSSPYPFNLLLIILYLCYPEPNIMSFSENRSRLHCMHIFTYEYIHCMCIFMANLFKLSLKIGNVHFYCRNNNFFCCLNLLFEEVVFTTFLLQSSLYYLIPDIFNS